MANVLNSIRSRHGWPRCCNIRLNRIPSGIGESSRFAGWHLNPDRVAQAWVARAYASAPSICPSARRRHRRQSGVAEPYRLLTHLSASPPPLLGYMRRDGQRRPSSSWQCGSFPVSRSRSASCYVRACCPWVWLDRVPRRPARPGLHAARVKQLLVEALKSLCYLRRGRSRFPCRSSRAGGPRTQPSSPSDFDAYPEPNCRPRFHGFRPAGPLARRRIDGRRGAMARRSRRRGHDFHQGRGRSRGTS